MLKPGEIVEIPVSVTEDDLKCGIRNSPRYCPVARAIRRCTGSKQISVTKGLIQFTMGDYTIRTIPEAELRYFIVCFDRPAFWRKKPQPGNIIFEITGQEGYMDWEYGRTR